MRTFTQFLAEQGPPYEYGSTQFNLPAGLANAVLSFGAQIPTDQLAAEGRELEPHVTILYGLTTEDPDDVRAVVMHVSPVIYELGKLAAFTQHPEADVLYVSVKSPTLTALHHQLSTLQHATTQPKYVPHVTVAYLRKGAAQQWIGDERFVGRRALGTVVHFTMRDGTRASIPLTGMQHDK